MPKKEVTKEQIIDIVEKYPDENVMNTISKIVTQATEMRDKFIFKTMSAFCIGVTQMEITKKDLEDALLMWKNCQPVEPFKDHEGKWTCGNCHKETVGWYEDAFGIKDGKRIRYDYCRICGRPVKWE